MPGGLLFAERKGLAMPNLEEAIRERAYHLWSTRGQGGRLFVERSAGNSDHVT